MSPGLDGRAEQLARDNVFSEEALHRRLADFNRRRLQPALADGGWTAELQEELQLRLQEGRWLEAERRGLQRALAGLPAETGACMAWFAALREPGPRPTDPLFPWLAAEAGIEQMRWFLLQDTVGDAGLEDWLALVQLQLPAAPRQMLARQCWELTDHGGEALATLRARLALVLRLRPALEETVWEALALNNLMLGLAANRRYAYQAIGALAASALTAAARLLPVHEGLRRLGISAPARRYFARQAELAQNQADSWIGEVLGPLVSAEPRSLRPMAEGALLRLQAEQRCCERYRRELGVRRPALN